MNKTEEFTLVCNWHRKISSVQGFISWSYSFHGSTVLAWCVLIWAMMLESKWSSPALGAGERRDGRPLANCLQMFWLFDHPLCRLRDRAREQGNIKGTRTNNIFPLTVIAHAAQLSSLNSIIYPNENFPRSPISCQRLVKCKSTIFKVNLPEYIHLYRH